MCLYQNGNVIVDVVGDLLDELKLGTVRTQLSLF